MIDQSMFQHDRFTVVTPELVKEVGGNATDAVVLAHIHWRLVGDAPYAVEHDGERWWPGSIEAIAEWTGLSFDQARRALKKLLDGGYLERKQLRIGGNYDRTFSYRLPMWRNRQMDVAESPNLHVAESPNLPSIEDIEDIPPIVPQPTFDDFYEIYPVKKSKDAARRAWAKAIKRADPADIVDGARRFAGDPNLPEKQFIKHPATWLNGGCWEDDPEPQRQQHSASVDGNLAEYQRLYGGGQIAGARSVPALDSGIR